MLKVRMRTAEAIETMLHRCVTWTLGRQHYANDLPCTPPPSRALNTCYYDASTGENRGLARMFFLSRQNCLHWVGDCLENGTLAKGPNYGRPWQMETRIYLSFYYYGIYVQLEYYGQMRQSTQYSSLVIKYQQKGGYCVEIASNDK